MTPQNKRAGSMDRVMLLALWTRQLEKEQTQHKFIAAGMGKPSFPMNDYAAKTAAQYWSKLWSDSQDARHIINSKGTSSAITRDEISKRHAAVDYGNPRGELAARKKMAHALNSWYGSETKISEDNILFTVGGVGALYCAFEVINHLKPNGRIVTPVPYYSLYKGTRGKNRLYPIPVMNEPGYRLTAEALEKAIQEANKKGDIDGGKVSAFLFSDPSNPLGNFVSEEELKKIVIVLLAHPEIYVIVDGAYEEMRLDGRKHVSLLTVAPPELRNRMILIRSATKALSLAGERMAVLVAFDEQLMTELLQQNIDMIGHAPISLQYAFAEAMNKLDETELSNFVGYYKPQVDYVMKRIHDMGASLPDPEYQTTATFYVLADLSDLIGMDMPSKASRAILAFNKNSGRYEPKTRTKNDEDVIYTLLFEDRIMLCPCSYCGIKTDKGYVRITCSGGDSEMQLLMDRLEYRLTQVRQEKQKILLRDINNIQKKLIQESPISSPHYSTHKKFLETLNSKIESILKAQSNGSGLITAKRLKNANDQLKILLSDATATYKRSSYDEKVKAAITIQSFFRGCKSRKETNALKKFTFYEWVKVVNENVDHVLIRQKLYQFNADERLTFKPWRDHLNRKANMSNMNTEESSHIFRVQSKL